MVTPDRQGPARPMPHTLAYGRSIDSLDVVLVQDNRGSQAIMRSMISSLRVRRLRVFERAEEALGQMMIDPPHVVVTDWDMKPMSGYRFIRTVRGKSMEPLCFVPIIVAMVNATA
jgi:two-component system chemotaxis response regulator CheY